MIVWRKTIQNRQKSELLVKSYCKTVFNVVGWVLNINFDLKLFCSCLKTVVSTRKEDLLHVKS